MCGVTARKRLSRSYSRDRFYRGFSLVALLISTALGVALLSATASTAVAIVGNMKWQRADAELLSRSVFALRLLATEMAAAAVTPFVPINSDSVCGDPREAGFVGIVQVTSLEGAPCLYNASAMPGQPLWVLDTFTACRPEDCVGNPVRDVPEAFWCGAQWSIRLQRERGAPSCNEIADDMHWQRRVFFLRHYALQPGDGGSALMVRAYLPDTRAFGRVEMLLWGVRAWHWQEQTVLGACAESTDLTTACRYRAARVQLLLEGQGRLPVLLSDGVTLDWPYALNLVPQRHYEKVDAWLAAGAGLEG